MFDIVNDFQVLMDARRVLVQGFYKSYDPSRLWQENKDIAKSRRHILGEGRHFRSYLIPRQGEGLDLAMNVAKLSFLERGPGERKSWLEACKGLMKVTHPLLPPFEVLEGDNDALLFVMPYCEVPLSIDELKTSPITTRMESLKRLLTEQGLIMDDYWQLRRCRGHEFITDFSDLKRSSVDFNQTTCIKSGRLR
ncbi:MAG: hypothetical protein H7249_14280 [Chitinophagaceae bacterium]|nr:hypothetical protein [Oligoflexus sp.]